MKFLKNFKTSTIVLTLMIGIILIAYVFDSKSNNEESLEASRNFRKSNGEYNHQYQFDIVNLQVLSGYIKEKDASVGEIYESVYDLLVYSLKENTEYFIDENTIEITDSKIMFTLKDSVDPMIDLIYDIDNKTVAHTGIVGIENINIINEQLDKQGFEPLNDQQIEHVKSVIEEVVKVKHSSVYYCSIFSVIKYDCEYDILTFNIIESGTYGTLEEIDVML